MGLVLQLVETGADARRRGIEVLEIDRPRDLSDIANLGLTLPEAKQLLARVQQAVVAVQARDHAALRPDCSRCGTRCQVKDWQSRQIATLFGTVAVRLPRFRCSGCGRSEAGVSWPAYCRSTPELDQLQAHLSALMSYRVAAGVLAHLLPVAAETSHETLRCRTLKLGEQLRDAATVPPEPAPPEPAAMASAPAVTLGLDSTYIRLRARARPQAEASPTGDRPLPPRPERLARQLRRATPGWPAGRNVTHRGRGQLPGQQAARQVAANALVAAWG